MKSTKKSKLNWIARGLGLAVLLVGATPAQARIINGHYVGRLPNYNLDTSVFVQSVQQSNGRLSYFGIILATNDIGNRYGSIYSITELPDGLQSWVQMFQNDEGQLTSEPGQHPTYAVRTVYEGKSWRSARLQFTVTDFGKTLGCADVVTDAELDFGFLGLGTHHLMPMPNMHFKIESRKDISAYYDNGVLTGSMQVGPKNVQGDFQLVPRLFMSIAEMRQRTPDPEAESLNGTSEKRELQGVIIASKSAALIDPKYFFNVLEIPKTSEIGQRKDLCFGHAIEFNEN